MQTTDNTSNTIILGLGREGYSSYRYLKSTASSQSILLVDDQDLKQLEPHWQEVLSKDNKTSFLQTPDAIDQLKNENKAKLEIFKSSGIPPSHKFLTSFPEDKITITSNTQLFFSIVKNKQLIIGVTGTKGKSTTASVIHHVLEKAGLNSLLGGNIGIPALDLLYRKTHQPIYVLELSAHQLRDLTYSPDIAVVQDITPEHLDYYSSFEEYFQAKSRITRFQSKEDLVIYNLELAKPSQIASLSKAKHIAYSLEKKPQSCCWREEKDIITNCKAETRFQKLVTTKNKEQETELKLKINKLPLRGEHNLLNIMPALIISRVLRLSNQQIIDGLTSFTPLPHRLEHIATRNNVEYYNDSLSTTPEATIAAIKSFKNKPIVLIAGGYDRKQDFTQLAKVIAENNVKALVLFPSTGIDIAKAVKTYNNKTHIKIIKSMQKALITSQRESKSGDVVLLSPASASFGLFKDYKDRGEQFSKQVSLL